MALTVNYSTDLGELIGFYPVNVGLTPLSLSLFDFLPRRIKDRYQDIPRAATCRNNALRLRKLRLTFTNDFVAEIEIPVPMTLEEIRSFRQSTGATLIETIGESINYAKLRWLVGDGTL